MTGTGWIFSTTLWLASTRGSCPMKLVHGQSQQESVRHNHAFKLEGLGCTHPVLNHLQLHFFCNLKDVIAVTAVIAIIAVMTIKCTFQCSGHHWSCQKICNLASRAKISLVPSGTPVTSSVVSVMASVLVSLVVAPWCERLGGDRQDLAEWNRSCCNGHLSFSIPKRVTKRRPVKNASETSCEKLKDPGFRGSWNGQSVRCNSFLLVWELVLRLRAKLIHIR